MYEVRVDAEHGCVHVRFSDGLQAADPRRALGEILAHPDYRAGMAGCVDLRAVSSLEIVEADVRAVVALVAERLEDFRASRWAAVAGSDVAFGVARQFQSLRDPLPYELQVFRSMEAACDWLGVPPPP